MQLPEINKNASIAVLGLGNFGMNIARDLCENNYQVLCCDKNPDPVHEISDVATNAIQADVTKPYVLKNMGLKTYDVVIVGFCGNFEETLITTMQLKEMGIPFVLTKANGPRQEKILESIGADKVVNPETEMAQKVVQVLMKGVPMQYVYRSDNFEIIEMSPKKDWVGKSLTVLNLPVRENMKILTVLRGGQPLPKITGETLIAEKDVLIVLYTLGN